MDARNRSRCAAARSDEKSFGRKSQDIFFDLKDGATIPSKVKIRFGIENMEIAPAGTVEPNTGHHHLLIDTRYRRSISRSQAISTTFILAACQTEAEITLPAGEHTLQLLLGDQAHIPHFPPVVSESNSRQGRCGDRRKDPNARAGWRQCLPDRAGGRRHGRAVR